MIGLLDVLLDNHWPGSEHIMMLQKTAKNLSKIVAGSQRVTSRERTLRGSKGIQPSLVTSIHFSKL